MSTNPADMASIYGMLNVGSDKDQKKIKYRTLKLPKHGATAVMEIEGLEMIKQNFPKEIQDSITRIQDIFDKALISTTSIDGFTMNMLTTQRSKIEFSDPRAKKGFMAGMFKPKQQEHAEG